MTGKPRPAIELIKQGLPGITTDMPDDDIRTIAEFVSLPFEKVKGIVWLAEAYLADKAFLEDQDAQPAVRPEFQRYLDASQACYPEGGVS